jgi:hypothetical protein
MRADYRERLSPKAFSSLDIAEANMSTSTSRFRLRRIAFAATMIALWDTSPAPAQTTAARIDEALQNITTLVRSGRVGYATFWDGNKYIQCRRWPTRKACQFS